MNEEEIKDTLFEFVPAESTGFMDMDLLLWSRELLGDNKKIHEWPDK